MAVETITLVRYVNNSIAFYRAFKTWEGPVGTTIDAAMVAGGVAARVEAPHPGGIPNNRTGINYSTGDLASQIRTSRSRSIGGDLEGQIVAVPKHAIMVHEGTIPHVIKPRNPTGKLVFFWAKKGRVVSLNSVNHPGTRANQFLVRALVRVMRRFV